MVLVSAFYAFFSFFFCFLISLLLINIAKVKMLSAMLPLEPAFFSSYPCSIILDRYVLESAKTEDKIKLYRRGD